mgnify:CR=1 FL=1
MNRIINTLALATAGLVLLCGCSADPATDEAAPGGNDGKTVPVSFAAELPATRATIEIGDDRFNGAWEVDIDKLGIHATLNGVAQINKPFVFSSEGIFKGELTPGTGAWTGSLVAAVINLDFWKALLSALLGVLGAGFVMTLLSYGVAAIF